VAVTLTATNPMRVVLLAILIFEVVVYGLAIPVMILVSDVSPVLAGVLGGAAALLALMAAALMRRPVGYYLGWLTQPVGVALGVLTVPMFVIGTMFFGLWVLSFVLGKRLDHRPGTPAAA
jgi:Protein of unknown function (DUF4233)